MNKKQQKIFLIVAIILSNTFILGIILIYPTANIYGDSSTPITFRIAMGMSGPYSTIKQVCFDFRPWWLLLISSGLFIILPVSLITFGIKKENNWQAISGALIFVLIWGLAVWRVMHLNLMLL